MANSGSFIVDIKDIHLDWGIDRNPGRDREIGEGYIKIPISDAQRLNLYNSKFGNGVFIEGHDEYGKNLFHAKFVDGFLEGKDVILKTSGNSGVGSTNYVYAKNLHGAGDLKLIKNWFLYAKATTNNKVRVTVISPDTIQLEII
ncbi:hypothetical protein A2U17_00020 [Fusobacterium necrophorum subsp. funduliforme]|uniref:hypothetical protein n=1 Tax=Fusobacterium necrophorum TaxID=859 RepID=UPI0007880DD3|nr:hypothetical protein [Fusobacterium necrophorum]KYM56185.1 hypothetical protein A2U17_00020 [Fusobacterium necrophorum subsp. funduliforme]